MALTNLETKLLAALKIMANTLAVPQPGSKLQKLIAEAEAAALDDGDAGTLDVAMACEAAVDRFRAGKHEVQCNIDGDAPFVFDADKPFCRVEWYSDSGDASVGIPAVAFWQLAENQDGTVWADMIAAQT